ncbi:MAG: S-layer homology domain-containing protein, partial [Clostridiales bacterium]
LKKQGKEIKVDPAALNSFADKAKIAAWAKESCAVSVQSKLMGGKENNKFAPGDFTSKGESAAILARLHRYLNS